jgi:aryl-alcohol dehydrogenase-like predicted oxidoreductase
MKYRPLGASGLEISEIGFGGWGIGGLTEGMTSYGATDDAQSLRALDHAREIGINFFDTSSVYGYGHSETLIGRAFAGCRDRVIIASKAGFTAYDRPPDFSPRQLRQSLETSLARLGTDYLDLLQLHNPAPTLLDENPDICETLRAMKADGLIRAHGISVRNPEDGIAALDAFDFDAVQVNLNMMDIRAIDSGLLDLAAARGVGIIARTPLCFGFLSGEVSHRTEFRPGDHRRMWPRNQVERWSEGALRLNRAVPAPDGQTRSQIALRFCLSHAGISTVIPGIMTCEEAAENAQASAFGPLSEGDLRAVAEIHRDMEFFVPPDY